MIPTLFDIPRLERKAVDADASAWGDAGFRVELMPDKDGVLKPAADFDARFRLAWNEQGLLLLLTVKDDVIEEAADIDMLWSKDAFEVFVASAPGVAEYCHLLVSPGVDPAQPRVRMFFNPKIKSPIPRADLAATVVTRGTPGGYVAEVLFPWKNLGLTPKAGDQVAFQLMVDDFDGGRGGRGQFNALWFPNYNTSRDSKAMHVLRLTEKQASPPQGVGASAAYERFRNVRVTVVAGSFADGKPVTVRAGDRLKMDATMQPKDGRAAAQLMLPMPEPGSPYPPLEVLLDGQPVKTISLPDADVVRTEAFLMEKLAFGAFCFRTKKFPGCDFEHPELVERLIGPYTIAVRCFDAQGNPAGTAENPGRYATVVEISHGGGRVSKRFYTLFRAAPAASSRERGTNASATELTLKLPSDLGIAPEVAAAHVEDVNAYASGRFASGLAQDTQSAVLFAGLHDLSAMGNAPTGSAVANTSYIDRQWWVNFKRKYYGMDKLYSKPFVSPVPVTGESARVIRAGTPAEAGMKPDTVERIDAIGKAWAADAGEGFNVCVVRHGVVVVNKGYWAEGGRPFSENTQCQIASTTKFLSSILFMQLVDQGLVKLDDTVEQYLPALRDVPVKRKMTLRDLYMHTTGFPGHWGDEMNDLEEVVADYYPRLAVGVKQSYQGTGIAMAGKIVEMVSGEAIPYFYRRHLLDPLGCVKTEAATTGAGVKTIPMDLAKVGQMMLNGGAYGTMRFLKPETVQMMLPVPGKDRIGPDPGIRWGIGIKQYDSDGLSPRAFGHSGANGAFLVVDPAHDLVIAQTRDVPDKNYEDFKPKLIKAVLDGIADEGAADAGR